jgi:leucyl-tRNA synthetase
MDTFVDSSWYFLRFVDPANALRPFDPEIAARWLPVDQYVGGIEHAILHLLYARFICRVLKDLGMVAFEEPFARLFNQGMITRLNPATGKIEKMSKSRGNTVSPDELIAQYGADTERVYTLFMGPPEKECEWSPDGVAGAYRFLARVHEVCAAISTMPAAGAVGDTALVRKAHQTIRRVTDDIERFHFNVVVSGLMEFQRALTDAATEGAEVRETPAALHFAARVLLKLLHPVAPHLTEEWWERFGEPAFLLTSPWPEADPAMLIEQSIEIRIQVQGKLRDKIVVSRDLDPAEVERRAQAREAVQRWLGGRSARAYFNAQKQIINFVPKAEAEP